MLSHRSFVFTYYMELLDFGLGWHETFVFTTPLTHAAGCLLLPVLLPANDGGLSYGQVAEHLGRTAAEF